MKNLNQYKEINKVFDLFKHVKEKTSFKKTNFKIIIEDDSSIETFNQKIKEIGLEKFFSVYREKNNIIFIDMLNTKNKTITSFDKNHNNLEICIYQSNKKEKSYNCLKKLIYSYETLINNYEKLNNNSQEKINKFYIKVPIKDIDKLIKLFNHQDINVATEIIENKYRNILNINRLLDNRDNKDNKDDFYYTTYTIDDKDNLVFKLLEHNDKIYIRDTFENESYLEKHYKCFKKGSL